MSNLSQFLGSGAPVMLGQSTTFTSYGGVADNLVDSGAEYLRHGVLKVYSADYSGLLTRNRYLGVNVVAPAASSASSVTSFTHHNLFKVGTNYLDVTNANGVEYPTYAASIAGLNGAPSLSTPMYPLSDSVQAGDGSVIFTGYRSNPAVQVARTTNGSSLTASPGGTTSAASTTYPILAANGANIVWCIDLGGSAGNILTSANNGANWTSRTPTGGSAGVAAFLHYSPVMSKWLTAVGNTGTLLSSSDGFTWASETTGLAHVFGPANYAGKNTKSCASSPSVTLITGAGSGILRITAGPTYSLVTGGPTKVIWDGSKFIGTYGASDATYSQFLTSTDGLTWAYSSYPIQSGNSVFQYAVSMVDGRAYARSSTTYITDVTDSLTTATPTHVGVIASTSDWLRIK